jgi:hypothetical protein
MAQQVDRTTPELNLLTNVIQHQCISYGRSTMKCPYTIGRGVPNSRMHVARRPQNGCNLLANVLKAVRDAVSPGGEKTGLNLRIWPAKRILRQPCLRSTASDCAWTPGLPFASSYVYMMQVHKNWDIAQAIILRYEWGTSGEHGRNGKQLLYEYGRKHILCTEPSTTCS